MTNTTTSTTPESSLKKQARIAGGWYLAMAILSPLGLVYVPSKVIVDGDVAQTAQNILNHEFLFRTGILTMLIGQVIFLILGLTLYRLFKSVHETAAKLMLIFVVASVPIAFAASFFDWGALIAASTNIGLMDLMLQMREHAGFVVGIFWGLWLLPFGYLVIKSGWFPKVLGYLLLLSGLMYLVDSKVFLLYPDGYEAVAKVILAPMALGEIAMMLWLVIRGARSSTTSLTKG